MANPKLIIEVAGDDRKLRRTLKDADTQTKRFARGIERKAGRGGLMGTMIGGSMAGGPAAAGVAAGAAVGLTFLKKSIDAAKEAEVAQQQLDIAFQQSGQSAAKFGDQVNTSIENLSKVSAFDDEELTAAFSRLLRTTGSVEKATKDLALATDIARARNISLESAVKTVEAAETGRLTGLKRLGITLDKNTTSQEALDAAATKFARSAQAYGDTTAGSQDKLAVAFENLQEQIGAKLTPALEEMNAQLLAGVEFATRLVDAFSLISGFKIPGVGTIGSLAGKGFNIATHVGPVGVVRAVADPRGTIGVTAEQQEIILKMDGKTVGKVVTTQQTKAGKRAPVQKRGPHAGLRT